MPLTPHFGQLSQRFNGLFCCSSFLFSKAGTCFVSSLQFLSSAGDILNHLTPGVWHTAEAKILIHGSIMESVILDVESVKIQQPDEHSSTFLFSEDLVTDQL
jgi:hypothetical protein